MYKLFCRGFCLVVKYLWTRVFINPIPFIPPSLTYTPLSLLKGLVLKVVIPVKTGIQTDMNMHDFWIPTCVGMTKKLKSGTYDTKPLIREGG